MQKIIKLIRPAFHLGFACLSLGGIADLAQAYIPPTGFIIKTVAAKRAPFAGFVIQGVLTTPSGLSYPMKWIFQTKDSRFVAVVQERKENGGEALWIKEQKAGGLSVLPEVLFSAYSRSILTALKKKGISVGDRILGTTGVVSNPDEELEGLQQDEPAPGVSAKPGTSQKLITGGSHLERWQDLTAWVMGEKGHPQLWIEKDTFTPIRWTTDRFDVRFTQNKVVAGTDFSFSRIIEVWTADGKTKRFSFEVSDVEAIAEKKGMKPLPFPGGGNLPIPQVSSDKADWLSEWVEAFL